MALHRDIFWVGRQWAVTGSGMQAVDQRLKGMFDIETSLVWNDGIVARTRSLAWLNVADFDKALEVARARYPAPPRKILPLVESVLELIQPKGTGPAKPEAPPAEIIPQASGPDLTEPQRPTPRLLVMQAEHASAKFLPFWRVRRRTQAAVSPAGDCRAIGGPDTAV
jgi:hypothetical protein